MWWDIRDAVETDRGFIMKSYLLSWFGDKENSRIRKNVFMKHNEKIMTFLLSQNIKIACAKDFPDQIFSFLIYSLDPYVIHYCFTKCGEFRNKGIIKSLVESTKPEGTEKIWCSHATRVYDFKKIKYNLEYNPYLAIRRSYNEDKR